MTRVQRSLGHQRILIRRVLWCDRGWALGGGQLFVVFLITFQSRLSNHSWESERSRVLSINSLSAPEVSVAWN